MVLHLKDGDRYNTPVDEYYIESEQELEEIKNATVGSTVLILTADGLKVKMKHSELGWIDV